MQFVVVFLGPNYRQTTHIKLLVNPSDSFMAFNPKSLPTDKMYISTSVIHEPEADNSSWRVTEREGDLRQPKVTTDEEMVMGEIMI